MVSCETGEDSDNKGTGEFAQVLQNGKSPDGSTFIQRQACDITVPDT